MSNSKGSADELTSSHSARDSGDESEDSSEESEVLEYSPCGRWQKRREEVHQRDVPGIDSAFLAMDNDQGIEVVWNEVCISEKKSTKSQEDKIKLVFDNLIQIEHANIVKFHKYWTDKKKDKHRVIFITEFMSSGSLKQFLKKTKKNNKTLKAWRRWCTQILSALSYLHSFHPAIIHGNLRTDTIFIQHNGLIKIGSVAPDAIYDVKTYRQEVKNMHYVAPEYGDSVSVTPAVDIYSFGICALEMAALEIQGNGDSGKTVSEENIQKTLESLEDPLQKDFIKRCLSPDPLRRPSARELLFHTVLFEVHSLKLLAAHSLVNNATYLEVAENRADEVSKADNNKVMAEILHGDGRHNSHTTLGQAPKLELEKFLDDVRNGVFPLTAFASLSPPPVARPSTKSPETLEQKADTPEPQELEDRQAVAMDCRVKRLDTNPAGFHADTPEPQELEDRQAVAMDCRVKRLATNPAGFHLTVVLRMNDQMNRRLSCDFTDSESCELLAKELVEFGFISKVDEDKMSRTINDSMMKSQSLTSSPPQSQVIEQKA